MSITQKEIRNYSYTVLRTKNIAKLLARSLTARYTIKIFYLAATLRQPKIGYKSLPQTCDTQLFTSNEALQFAARYCSRTMGCRRLQQAIVCKQKVAAGLRQPKYTVFTLPQVCNRLNTPFLPRRRFATS